MCVWSPLVWCPSEKPCKDIADHVSRLRQLGLILRCDQILPIPDASTVCGPVQAHIHADHIHPPYNRLPEKCSYLVHLTPRGNMPDKDCVALELVAQVVEAILPRCALSQIVTEENIELVVQSGRADEINRLIRRDELILRM